MPIIRCEIVEGVLDTDQRAELIGALTDAMVSVRGEAIRPATTVLVIDVASGAWGSGGTAVTTDAALASLEG
jgi:4-oxalocrotonate tautomerase